MSYKKFSLSLVALAVSLNAYANWQGFGGDVQHTGFSPEIAPTNSDYIVHTINEKMKLSSQMLFNDSAMFFIVAAPTKTEMVCYDTVNYSNLWRTEIPFVDSGYGTWGTPFLYSNNLLFATDDKLVCLEATSGSNLWSADLNWYTVNSSVTVYSNKVIVPGLSYMNSDLGLMCYDIVSGSNLWNTQIKTNNVFSSCTAAIDANGFGYLAFANSIIKFDIESGTNIWEVSFAQYTDFQNISIVDSVILAVQMGYKGSQANLLAVSTHGVYLWQQVVKETDVPPAIAKDSSGNLIAIHVAGDTANQPTISAFDVASGSNLWSHEFIGNYSVMPFIADKVVYAAAAAYDEYYSLSAITNLTAIDFESGTIIHQFEEAGFPIGVQANKLYLQNLSQINVLESIPEPFYFWLFPFLFIGLKRFALK